MTRFVHAAFVNRRGHRLAGMLHLPAPSQAKGVCILMLSPGIKGRVGPHRLYLKLADPLASMGFHVLRFDFEGLGDSEGMLAERVLADVYNGVQRGRYVEDTFAAMDWMQETHGIRQFVASGLCGGSLTGLLTAERDDRIRSVLALGIPVILDGEGVVEERHATRGQLERLRQGYVRKILSPRAWVRFLGGRSSYGVIWRSLKRRSKSPADTEGHVADNTNPLFAPAFFSLVGSGRPILLIFSGADRLGFEFQEKFLERYSRRLASLGAMFEVHTIENANHVLSDPRWTRQVLDLAARWLDTVHPTPGSAVTMQP